jgi:hypothetical protein
MASVQLPFWPMPHLNGRIINVASIPQWSPFRYPGGKTWLASLAQAGPHGLKSKS